MNRSIEQIYRMSPEQRRAAYEAKASGIPISKVWIDGEIYTNYSQFQFLWEKSYVKEPVRSADGTIGNLNSYATFLTGHLLINFSLMSIDDYRRIMRQHYEKNEFNVVCYDPINNTKVALRMYFATEQMAKLRTIANLKAKNDGSFEEWVELVGVDDYTVELIGTNSNRNLVSIIYHLNPPQSTGRPDTTLGEPSIFRGNDFVVGEGASSWDVKNENFGVGYKFVGWNTQQDGRGSNYIDGQATTVYNDIVLYAQWEASSILTLTFDYGVAEPINKNGQPWYTETVTKGTPITVPDVSQIQTPIVEFDGKQYYPYSDPRWYKVRQRIAGEEVYTQYKYWSDYNSQIYLLYNVGRYNINFHAQAAEISDSSITNAEYGSAISVPSLVRNGYRFLGWFIDNDETKKFNLTTMPPVSLELYARWEVI